MFRLWCFDDAHNWGNDLCARAKALGHDARMFHEPRTPDKGFVFMHMHHHPQTRARDKNINRILSINPELTVVPEYRSARLYDDKIEQTAELSKWMPRTQVFFSPSPAHRFLEASPDFPIISKSTDGASSYNVRLLRTFDDAKLEIRQAFSDIGIETKYGQRQRGYLMWQKFCEGNEGDIRIIAIGEYRLVLTRRNRKDKPFASGSGNNTPITELSAHLRKPFEFANEFFEHERFTWCGIDLVYEHDRERWRLLETTVGWTMSGYEKCQFFDLNGEPTGMYGRDIWDVLIRQLERGVFI
jgi:glutathione synthase/RimK-type ligase-like ATP-grasp enzyme